MQSTDKYFYFSKVFLAILFSSVLTLNTIGYADGSGGDGSGGGFSCKVDENKNFVL